MRTDPHDQDGRGQGDPDFDRGHLCGQWYGGSISFCQPCQAGYEARYPQGWEGYPGDVCQHGTYVGGSGADYICGRCEAGEYSECAHNSTSTSVMADGEILIVCDECGEDRER